MRLLCQRTSRPALGLPPGRSLTQSGRRRAPGAGARPAADRVAPGPARGGLAPVACALDAGRGAVSRDLTERLPHLGADPSVPGTTGTPDPCGLRFCPVSPCKLSPPGHWGGESHRPRARPEFLPLLQSPAPAFFFFFFLVRARRQRGLIIGVQRQLPTGRGVVTVST